MRSQKITGLEECKLKIENLLKEYNCRIEYNEEIDVFIIFDVDTNVFEYLNFP